MKRIAFFVSAHGFGHAARTCAVIESLAKSSPDLKCTIITSVPSWFFKESLEIDFNYYRIETDVGLVQSTPLKEDLSLTLDALSNLYPLRQSKIQESVNLLRKNKIDLVVSDISTLGIATAKLLNVPSVLIENFTWDWIYESYLERHPSFKFFVDYLHNLFSQADYRILAIPYCSKNKADLEVNPIARNTKNLPDNIRKQIGIPQSNKLIMLTMGGIHQSYDFVDELKKLQQYYFLIPGGEQVVRTGNVSLFPHKSQFYHPDLVSACDVVVSKIGYSTLAEIYQAGKPFGYIPRNKFRESPFLETFIQENMSCLRIEENDFDSGDWIDSIDELVSLPSIPRHQKRGADQAAEFIGSILQGAAVNGNHPTDFAN